MRALTSYGSSDYAAQGYILHELAHVSQAGWGRHQSATTDAQRLANEQWANGMARLIAQFSGKPMPTSWPGMGDPEKVGFGNETFTYVPPADGSTQTAKQAYGGCG